MNTGLYILHLEDSEADAELIEAMLRKQEIDCEIERVDTREDFVAGLDRDRLDLILSDFSIPGFDGLSALALAREKRPTVPFIFVSGTLGEEVALDALKSGATDYVLKHRLPRLGPAVSRAIADAEERLALERAEIAMAQSEFKYRHLFECLSEAALLAHAGSGRVLDTNRQAEILFGRTRAEIVGLNIDRLLEPATLTEYQVRLVQSGVPSDRVVFDGEIVS